jgi:hypothetical protein
MSRGVEDVSGERVVTLQKEYNPAVPGEVAFIKPSMALFGERRHGERDEKREELNDACDCCFHVPFFPFLGLSL